jgi:hypothetical protein
VSEQHASTVPSSYRLWAAFAAVPFVDALVAFFGFPLVWYIGGHTGRPHDATEAAGSFALLIGLMGLVVTAGGAVPIVLWLMKRGAVSLRELITAGVLLGNVPFVLWLLGIRRRADPIVPLALR